jgi:hypothetical protein
MLRLSGAEDLHHFTGEIGTLKETYDTLARDASSRKLTWHR